VIVLFWINNVVNERRIKNKIIIVCVLLFILEIESETIIYNGNEMKNTYFVINIGAKNNE